ncbi:hypothetical protein OG883_42660 [Streptomyces sp. NBC_01142]|uniref:hypothetical protein n=1 Tax=Streptomyces sp. NBC_01142 TaxID=2975865 RepID=UPI00225A899C|nr:hypothetical protein [Streptomyces sp. NBC_01142]MCX4826346.1 hypothetical protein [Streptomyces sp. NBC_01142]
MTDTTSTHHSTPRSTGPGQEEADGGPELDSADREAVRRLAERAGLIPARKKPHADGGARSHQGPTSAQVWEIADLLVGAGVTLPLNILAVIADARASWQDDLGGKAAASQYRHCAHHLRQAAETIDRGEDATDEEQDATAAMASAYVEAAATHAREADLTI